MSQTGTYRVPEPLYNYLLGKMQQEACRFERGGKEGGGGRGGEILKPQLPTVKERSLRSFQGGNLKKGGGR